MSRKIFLFSSFLVFGCSLVDVAIVEASWQSMSPFQIGKLDAAWGAAWGIRGGNWRHHLKHKISPGTPFDDSAGAIVQHGFSTCPDATPPRRNYLSSPPYHLPHGASLPAVITAEFSFIVSEACLEAQRPYCSSVELWLLEGVAPTSQTLLGNETSTTTMQQLPEPKTSFLSDSAAWPGSPLLSAAEQFRNNNNCTERKSTLSFAINRPPFKLQFRDRRGACLEVVDASLSITSCFVGSARKSLLDLMGDAGNSSVSLVQAADPGSPKPTTTETFTGPTTLPPIGMTTPSTEALLTSLDCKCPAGYWRPVFDRCEACPPNTFADEPHANAFCSQCPPRSTSPFPGSTICVCEEGSFRSAGEDAKTPCTTSPSAPRQLVATYFDVHTVSVNWTEPEDNGGRTDLTYQVQCVAGCDDVTITRKDPHGEVRIADIKTRESLETTFVTIRVYALNGVSAIAGPSYARYFEAVITLRSSDADAAYAHIPDRVFILIGIFGGAGLVAAFFVVYAVMRHFRERRRERPMIVIASSSEDALEPNRTKQSSSVIGDDDDTNNADHSDTGKILVISNNGDGPQLLHNSNNNNQLLNHGDDTKVPLVEINSASSPTHKNAPGGIKRFSAYSAASSGGENGKLSASSTSDETRLVSS